MITGFAIVDSLALRPTTTDLHAARPERRDTRDVQASRAHA
jgi:hypothetical protein